ncbi:hypothetical protein ACEQ7L_000773 [Vibrio fluvialis]|uniref:hypothetical protein n=1 Tax=Vibrio fluvialis TaxID=676 RepID=UPI001EEAEFCA|nr:hypothetical protein [Vibrio fluvialis]EKO3379629.1 hypothetical protein [Vibrio fluvialis]MCG6375309.1 hypothetical protein [Vibrio fluvialis]
MKKFAIVIGLFFSSIVFAAEPSFSGVFYSDYPGGLSDKSWTGYPSHNASYAGNGYLFQKNTDSVNYVSNQKNLFIKNAREEAKEFAVSNKKNSYAVLNMSFQVVRTENTTELYTDYYVVAW